MPRRDRKSTRLNSSHANISYAVFCLKKKKLDIRLEAEKLANLDDVGYQQLDVGVVLRLEAHVDARSGQPVDPLRVVFFFFNDTATTEIYTLSLHDALPISRPEGDEYPTDQCHGGAQ